MPGSSRPLRSRIAAINDMVNSTSAGLKAGKSPERTPSGDGGSYFMYKPLDEKPVAVFKPLDEEPNAVNHSNMQQRSEGWVSEVNPAVLRIGTTPGKGGFRETAVYRLDHPFGKRRSPFYATATFVSCSSRFFKDHTGRATEKFGSLQQFMPSSGDCGSYARGPPFIPKDEVHKIAVLDIRFANTDRHGGNILISESKDKLIPIDHGGCLPTRFGGGTFCWLDWPQAKEKFSLETIEYIEKLDAQKDIDLLESYGPGMALPTARVFRVSTMLLQRGAAKGLTPFQIGDKMCRPFSSVGLQGQKSEIEHIFELASSISRVSSEDVFLSAISKGIDNLLG